MSPYMRPTPTIPTTKKKALLNTILVCHDGHLYAVGPRCICPADAAIPSPDMGSERA